MGHEEERRRKIQGSNSRGERAAPRTVWVVEDDEILSGNLRLYLERSGWAVDVCPSAELALAMLETAQPDIVLTDYLLPGKTGLDLLKGVIAVAPQVKVVMLTGNGDAQIAVETMKAGAFDYLVKPFPLNDLVAVLRKALASS